MADGFGFQIEGAAPVETPDFIPSAPGPAAAPPETWWGELLEFVTPLLVSIAAALAITAAAPGGWALLGAGFGA